MKWCPGCCCCCCCWWWSCCCGDIAGLGDAGADPEYSYVQSLIHVFNRINFSLRRIEMHFAFSEEASPVTRDAESERLCGGYVYRISTLRCVEPPLWACGDENSPYGSLPSPTILPAPMLLLLLLLLWPLLWEFSLSMEETCIGKF